MRYKKRDPVDYSKCNQFVTIYHQDAGNVTKTHVPFAFFDFRKNELVNRTGQTESNTFLLVIPKGKNGLSEQPVFNGDKVILGELGDITLEQWRELIPAKVPNMAVVKYVDPKYWQGEVIHWEAGG